MDQEERFYPEIEVIFKKNGVNPPALASHLHLNASIYYVGNVIKADNAELQVILPPELNGEKFYAVETPGKQIIPKKNWGELTLQSEPVLIYKKKIRIHLDPQTYVGPYTRPYQAENFFRIIAVKDDYLKIIDVGLVSQKGKFFVVKQLTRQGRCCRNGVSGSIVLPDFLEKWPNMVKFLAGIMRFETNNLTYEYASVPSASTTMKAEEAEVIWWDLVKQFGLVVASDGRIARAHWSNFTDADCELVYAKPGDIIKFEKIGCPRQNPEGKTEFEWEIYDCKIVE